MDLIYVTDRNAYSTESFVKKLAVEKLNMHGPVILRNQHGKPYFQKTDGQPTLHFSVSHTDNKLFVVFSNREIGIDVENKNRNVDYSRLIRRVDESFSVASTLEFLRLWTAKESVVKYMGGAMAPDAKDILFSPVFDCVQYREQCLPVVVQHFEFENYLVAVCSESEKTYSFCEII